MYTPSGDHPRNDHQLGPLHLVSENKKYLSSIANSLKKITLDLNYNLRYQKLISLYFKMASPKDDLLPFYNQ